MLFKLIDYFFNIYSKLILNFFLKLTQENYKSNVNENRFKTIQFTIVFEKFTSKSLIIKNQFDILCNNIYCKFLLQKQFQIN